MQKLLLVYYHSENRATSQVWSVLPNMVFSPDLGEKNGGVLLSPARVQPRHGAGRKESSGTGLALLLFILSLSVRARVKRGV